MESKPKNRLVPCCSGGVKKFLFARACLSMGLGMATLLLACQSTAHGAIVVNAVGTPGFDFVDSHLFTAPGDPLTGASFRALFPEHFPTRLVHSGPYNQEFTNGLALTGYAEKQIFNVTDFTDPMAVHMGFVLVPNALAPSGSSFDFANGPIIPVGVMPIVVRGDVFLNGAPYEIGAFGFGITSNDGFNGLSHVVADVWENSAFAPGGLSSLVGDYEYRVTVRDASNNGYNIVGSFSVVPEPTQLGVLGAVVCFCFRRRGR